jgi:membrane protein required for colicin V production
MIDIIFVVILVIAVIKGLRKGLAVALFSIVAFIIGLAAAIKLSAAVAVYLEKNIALSNRWLPVISFLVVFIVVVVLVNLGGKLVEKTFEMAFLGWVNRIGGAIFYVLLYTLIFSILLFYAEKMHFIKQETVSNSIAYPYLKPWGPAVINTLGKIIPLFKDSFQQLESFFESLSDKIAH